MSERTKSPRAGGALLAFSILGGAGIGIAYGQPTIGLIAGTAIGVLLALLTWALDSRR